MAKLRHFAMAVPNTDQTAKFYEQVFGMKRVRESASAILLSDGVISLAILDNKTSHEALGAERAPPFRRHRRRRRRNRRRRPKRTARSTRTRRRTWRSASRTAGNWTPTASSRPRPGSRTSASTAIRTASSSTSSTICTPGIPGSCRSKVRLGWDGSDTAARLRRLRQAGSRPFYPGRAASESISQVSGHHVGRSASPGVASPNTPVRGPCSTPRRAT